MPAPPNSPAPGNPTSPSKSATKKNAAFATLTARVSTVYGEVFTQGTSVARVSTVYGEVFSQGTPTVRVSTVYGEFVTRGGGGNARVSTIYIEVPTYIPFDQRLGRVTPSIFRPKDVIKVRSKAAYPAPILYVAPPPSGSAALMVGV